VQLWLPRRVTERTPLCARHAPRAAAMTTPDSPQTRTRRTPQVQGLFCFSENIPPPTCKTFSRTIRG